MAKILRIRIQKTGENKLKGEGVVAIGRYEGGESARLLENEKSFAL